MNYFKKYGLRGCIFLALKKYNSVRTAPLLQESFPDFENPPAVKSWGDKDGDAPYTLYVAEGLEIKERAVEYMAKALEVTGGDAIYCDEEDFYKPDYSPDCSRDYAGCFLIKSEYVKEKARHPEDLLWGLKVCHLKRPLATGKRTLKFLPPQYETPKGGVSIIIPTKDNFESLSKCISSIKEKTRGIKYEIIIADSSLNSETRAENMALADVYISADTESSLPCLCNLGAKSAQNRFYLFLGDNIRVNDGDWLFKLSYHAAKRHVGAVGAKLCTSDGKTIQHSGIINTGLGPVCALMGWDDTKEAHNKRNRGVWNYSAVTGACLMIEDEKFTAFNEKLPVAYSDVALCFDLLKNGLYNLVDNSITLTSEGRLTVIDYRETGESAKLRYSELDRLFEMYPEFLGKDDFLNPNLNLYKVDFQQESSYIKARSHRYRKMDKLPPEGDLNYRVDFALEGERTIVGGYCFKRGYDLLHIVFESENKELFAFTPVRDVRMDLESIYGKDAIISGFYLNFGVGILKAGNYRVCLVMKNVVKGKSLCVKTDRWVKIYG